MALEFKFLWSSLIVYVAAGSLAVIGTVLGRNVERIFLALMTAALLLLGFFIGVRWIQVGHGPFSTMFDILYSNIFSLSLIYTLAYWRIKQIRPTAPFVFPLFLVMIGWLAVTDMDAAVLPPTFDTIWLIFHVAFGKVFLGSLLVSAAIAASILLRRAGVSIEGLKKLPDDESLDELAYRFVAVGLIFNILMLVSGAIWAQDAWGRYWAWDPLETWSFMTWLLLALAMHARVTFKTTPAAGAVMVIAMFVVAFLTLFGIPFISEQPHKGVI
jgi:ABC-type transport system involved in cytochrome c biogenesis permease subunit